MSEYSNVEKPFLDKLEALGWQVIDHGAKGIPQDPAISLRTSFKQVTLEQTFKQTVANINKTESGEQWLTETQLHEIYTDLLNQGAANLHEANIAIFELLTKNTMVEVNEVTGEASPVVRLIDLTIGTITALLPLTSLKSIRRDVPERALSLILCCL